MHAIVVAAPGVIELVTLDDPAPGHGEVVVRVAACGLCGTDLHLVDGELPYPLPVTPGHEFSGEIVAVGPGVEGWSTGDRVAVDPNMPCGTCRMCRRDRANLCENYAALGVTASGAAAEYVAAPAANCVRLPDFVDLGAAALIEPLSCSVRAFDLLPTRPDDHILIYGAGTMGLLNLALARSFGVANVSVVDLNADRLLTATAMGADATALDADQLDNPFGWDVVIDCTGAIAAIEDGLRRVGRGGTFLQFGVAPHEQQASWSPFQIYRDEITIVGSMAVLHSFERAAELFAGGAVDADLIVSDRVGLTDYADAIERFRRGDGGKIHVVPSQSARS